MSDQTAALPPPRWLQPLVAQLASRTKPLSVSEGRRLLQAVSVRASTATAWTRFDERFYTRSSVFRSDAVELLVMGWLGGQLSPLHNHTGSVCVLKVLAGEAIEIGYERSEIGLLTPQSVTRPPTGFLAASVDEDVHQVGNDKNTPLVTLHMYSPPLRDMELFPHSESILSERREPMRAARKTRAA